MNKLITAAMALVLVFSLTACAAPDTPVETTVNLNPAAEPGTITVSGKAEIEATPDVVQIRIGVETQGRTPGVARDRNNEAVNATMAAITELGIPEEDIQTGNINLNTQHDYSGNLSGYQMSTALNVTIREMEKAADVIDASINAGSNDLGRVEYLVSNRDELYNASLTQAVKLAREKAEALAALEGKTVGEVKSITETSDAVATVFDNPDTGGGDLSDLARSTVIQAGRTSVSAEVSVVFELK